MAHNAPTILATPQTNVLTTRNTPTILATPQTNVLTTRNAPTILATPQTNVLTTSNGMLDLPCLPVALHIVSLCCASYRFAMHSLF
jgi:hypothetical protein